MLRVSSSRVFSRYAVFKVAYSTKSLNVVFFGSDSISNPTMQLLYSDYLREDGLVNKLEVRLLFWCDSA